MAGENAEVAEVVAAPVPGTPEYEAAMVAKVDENAAKAVSDAQGDVLTEPVQAAEEKAPEEAEKKSDESSEGGKKDDATDTAEEAAKAAGLDYASLQAEWEAGGLSEESYQALEKVGFGKDIVDQHIAGMEALATLHIMQAEEAAGGKDQLAAMQGWAAKALPAEDIKAYNDAVMGGKDQMLKAVGDLRTKYEAEYGRQPGLLGGRNASEGMQGYGSRAEMTADMRDPRYAKDASFRAKVAAKIGATTAF